VLGSDRRISEQWLVGASFGKSQTDVAMEQLASGAIDSWSGSIYTTWFNERSHFEGGVSYGKQKFEDTRYLQVESDLRSTTSNHDGKGWSAFAAGGMSFGTEVWSIEPYLSLIYLSAEEDGFEELGGNGMNQIVAGRSTKALQGEAGALFAVRQQLSHALLDWHASLALGGDLGSDDARVQYSYAGAPGTEFTLDGRPSDGSSTLYGLGVALIGDQSALSIDYRGLTNSDRAERFVSARVSLRF